MKRPIYWMLAAGTLLACNSATNRTAATQKDWSLAGFQKQDSVNPVIRPDAMQVFDCPVLQTQVRWEQKDVFNPAAVTRNDTVFLLYRAEDTLGKHGGTSRIGLAWSSDGLHFTKQPAPVLYPDRDETQKWEWDGGCEDPRVVQDAQGLYYMTYTAYDGDKARLFIATSPDLRHWTKHGSVFRQAFGGKYAGAWTKSGSIVSTYQHGTPVATRINGKYWMYWGDQDIWIATSDDLINWWPLLDSTQSKTPEEMRGIAKDFPGLHVVFGPRSKKFDSDLVESGPPAMITPQGIVLLYNSRNTRLAGDTTLAEGTYAAGQVLLDPKDPGKVLDRLNQYFIRPEKPYEITGQVNQVCFLEGLVQCKGRWLLYYGTADSKIAVAVRPASTH